MILKKNIKKIFEEYSDGLIVVKDKSPENYNLRPNEKFNLYIKSYKIDENRQIKELISMRNYANTLKDKGLNNFKVIMHYASVQNPFTSFALHDKIMYTRDVVKDLFSQSSRLREYKITEPNNYSIYVELYCKEHVTDDKGQISGAIKFLYDEYDRLVNILTYESINGYANIFKTESFEYDYKDQNKLHSYKFKNYTNGREYYCITYTDEEENSTIYNYYSISNKKGNRDKLFYTCLEHIIDDNTIVELSYAYVDNKVVLDQIVIKEFDGDTFNEYNLIGNDYRLFEHRTLFEKDKNRKSGSYCYVI